MYRRKDDNEQKMKIVTSKAPMTMTTAGCNMVRLSRVSTQFCPSSLYHLARHVFWRSYMGTFTLAIALAKGCDMENDWMTWVFYPTCLHCSHSLKMRKKHRKAYMSGSDEPKASVSPKLLAAMISNLLAVAFCFLTITCRYLLISTNIITISSTTTLIAVRPLIGLLK